MRTVAIPYQVLGNQLFTQILKWPARCACCGREHPGSWTPLGFDAEATFDRSHTVRTSYPLKWSVPYCQACKKHVSREMLTSGGMLFAPVLIVLFLMWAGLGYWIFTMGYATETIATWQDAVAILAWLGAGALMVLLALVLYRWFERTKEQRI